MGLTKERERGEDIKDERRNRKRERDTVMVGGSQPGTGETARLVWPGHVTLATEWESFVAVPGCMGSGVCMCVCLCGYKCIKSNTGFLSANNKAHGFTWLCWDLEIHCGSMFSSQRRVYAFCTEECQQPWGFLQRVRGSSWGIHKPEFHKWSLKCKKNRQCAEREREMKTLGSVWCTSPSCFLHGTLFFLRLVII